MNTTLSRHSGVLLHISSLPSPYGIGDLGKESYEFIDFLCELGCDHWQILPLGPTGFGNSPYASRSTFAGNELFIDLRELVALQYLSKEDVKNIPNFCPTRVDYSSVTWWKITLLRRAATQFLRDASTIERADFEQFCTQHSYWLDDYVLFVSLYELHQDARWFSVWSKEFSHYDKEQVISYTQARADELVQWKVLQYFFHTQWSKLRTYAHSRGISIIGDLPIFVAADSVDTWSNIQLFKTDKEGHFSCVSGVPPDFFSSTGQLWGNPVYDWDRSKEDLYRWWIQRITRALQWYDAIRIDHFRGFDAYWEIPYGSTTAETGSWTKSPGIDFFHTLISSIGEIPIIAEDLGVVTEEVEQLRDLYGFPGMKIGQFGFELQPNGTLNGKNSFLPHNYGYNFVAYTGTHDNDTTKGWFSTLEGALQQEVCAYLRCSENSVVWELMRAIIASHAKCVIFPMQDLLGYDSQGRFNTPSTCNNRNWTWKMGPKDCNKVRKKQFRAMLLRYGRISNN